MCTILEKQDMKRVLRLLGEDLEKPELVQGGLGVGKSPVKMREKTALGRDTAKAHRED